MQKTSLSSHRRQSNLKNTPATSQTSCIIHSTLPLTGLIFLIGIEAANIIYMIHTSNSSTSAIASIVLNVFFLTVQLCMIPVWKKKSLAVKTKERMTILLYTLILFSNIELVWMKASETLALCIIASIYLGMILPITFFNCKFEKFIQYMIPSIYFLFCLWRSEDQENTLFLAILGITFIGLGLSLILISEYIRRINSSIAEIEQKKAPVDREIIEFFMNEAEDSIVVLDHKFNVRKLNNQFLEFFRVSDANSSNIPALLSQIMNVACYDEICDLLGRNSINLDIDRNQDQNDSISEIPFRITSISNLYQLATILFKYTSSLKMMNIGWDHHKKMPMIYKTTGMLEKNNNVIISFSFINTFDEDLLLIRLYNQENSKTTSLSVRDISSIIHDIRTPIYASNAMLQSAIHDGTVSRDIVETIIQPAMDCNQRLLLIVNDILDLAQILEGKFRLSHQSIELRKVLEEPVKMIRALGKLKQISTYLDIKTDVPPMITTDPNRLIQIIFNLMGNSLKFTNPGGRVTLTVSSNDPRYIDFSVVDTGTGIKPEYLKKLFTAFEKLNEVNENVIGVGLGLCISNSIAKVLGKKINVKSEYGHGATFSFSVYNHDHRTEGSANSSLVLSIYPSLFPSLTSPSLKKKSRFSLDEQQYEEKSRKFSEDMKKLVIDNRKESNEVDIVGSTDSVLNKTVHCEYHPSLKDEQMTRVDFDSELKPRSKKNLEIKRTDSDIPLLQNIDQTMNMSMSSDCTCPQVILIDDDIMNQNAFEAFLRSIKIRGLKFGSGDETIAYLKDNKVNCDKCNGPRFILVDQHMPMKDGYETSKELIELFDAQVLMRIPLVGFSADDNEEMHKKMNEIGVKHFLKKPLTVKTFERTFDKFANNNGLSSQKKPKTPKSDNQKVKF